MAQIIVRNLDNGLKARIAMQAKRHGHSMEEEVRQILARSISQKSTQAGDTLSAYFKEVHLDTPLASLPRQKLTSPDFGE